jgi:hypothetical protein
MTDALANSATPLLKKFQMLNMWLTQD